MFVLSPQITLLLLFQILQLQVNDLLSMLLDYPSQNVNFPQCYRHFPIFFLVSSDSLKY